MKKKYLALALAAVISTASAGVALAHHSFSMFNPDVEIVLKGKVARWAFTSPHTFMMIKTDDDKVWAFEGSAPPGLLTRDPSMNGDTFKEGEDITVVFCPLRDGRNGGAAGLYITPDGKVYNPADAGCRAFQRAAEWPTWIEKGYTTLEEAKKGEGIE